ncbi:MAG: hypothetical protein CHACPFDD_01911 [Phycisphaerae bacterium]|nr:hypothetical protein [Phycisphaerae bacterium]
MATQAPGNAPAAPRTTRTTRVGVVTSDKRDKTRRVAVRYQVQHPKYGKRLRREVVLHVHDEKNEARLGDTVEVAECRPVSKTKCWRLLRIVRKGAGGES